MVPACLEELFLLFNVALCEEKEKGSSYLLNAMQHYSTLYTQYTYGQCSRRKKDDNRKYHQPLLAQFFKKVEKLQYSHQRKTGLIFFSTEKKK